jgi:hypothetical protein
MNPFSLLAIAYIIAAFALCFMLRKRFGPILWPFAFIIVPIALSLLVAETRMAGGVLAIIATDILTAYIIAGVVSFVMLVTAHLWGDHILEYLDTSSDPGENTFNGARRRMNNRSLWGIGFLLSAFAYGVIGYIRTSATIDMIGAEYVNPWTKFLFFIFPAVSLFIGICAAAAWRSMRNHATKYELAKYQVRKVRVMLLGRASENTSREIMSMIEDGIMHDDPDVMDVDGYLRKLETEGVIRSSRIQPDPFSKLPHRSGGNGHSSGKVVHADSDWDEFIID